MTPATDTRWEHLARLRDSINPRTLGLIGAVAITLGSFGGGAIRYRGGVLDALGLRFFSYGHGAGFSNVLFFIGTAALIAAWIILGYRIRTTSVALREINRTLAAWVAPLALAAPMFSRDVYSYLMQGAMLRDGFDPYTEGAAVNPGPLLLEVSHDWRNTTTPYGPLHLWLGEGITSISGDNVTLGVLLYKIVSLAGFIAISWSIPKIAQHLGANPTWAQWIGVANPVMIFHLVGGMHNESVMVGLVSITIYLALRRHTPVVLLGAAIALKATAIIALPFLVWIETHRLSNKHGIHPVVAFIISGTWMTAITVATIAIITRLSGSSWGWVSQLSGNSKVINPLALPTLAADIITANGKYIDENIPYNTILSTTRTIGMIAMLLGLVIVWWLARKTELGAIRGTAAAYAVAVLFNAVTLPWYYASLISLYGVVKPGEKLQRVMIATSLFVALEFAGSGNHKLYDIPWVALSTALSIAAVKVIYSGTRKPSPVPAA